MYFSKKISKLIVLFTILTLVHFDYAWSEVAL